MSIYVYDPGIVTPVNVTVFIYIAFKTIIRYDVFIILIDVLDV